MLCKLIGTVVEKANGSIIVRKMLEKTLDVLHRQDLQYINLNPEEVAETPGQLQHTT